MPRFESRTDMAKGWQYLAAGSLSEQEKIDLVVSTGRKHARQFTEQVRALLDDQSNLVRYYALQTLVIDLKAHGPEVETTCWSYLENDPDEDMRSMAATCLGSLKAGTGEARSFHRLVSRLRGHEPSAHVRRRIYSALFQLSGKPPSEWPEFGISWRDLDKIEIDWEKIKGFEQDLGK